MTLEAAQENGTSYVFANTNTLILLYTLEAL